MCLSSLHMLKNLNDLEPRMCLDSAIEVSILWNQCIKGWMPLLICTPNLFIWQVVLLVMRPKSLKSDIDSWFEWLSTRLCATATLRQSFFLLRASMTAPLRPSGMPLVAKRRVCHLADSDFGGTAGVAVTARGRPSPHRRRSLDVGHARRIRFVCACMLAYNAPQMCAWLAAKGLGCFWGHLG